jgi:V/A-type H+-transporting ATPase subunit K
MWSFLESSTARAVRSTDPFDIGPRAKALLTRGVNEMELEMFFLSLSAALAVGIPALATGWAQSRIGPAAAAALAEKPELTVTVVLLIAIPETLAILGFVIAVLILMQGGG